MPVKFKVPADGVDAFLLVIEIPGCDRKNGPYIRYRLDGKLAIVSHSGGKYCRRNLDQPCFLLTRC